MTAANDLPKDVDLWFDPHCPWAWMTSRWLTEVAEARGLTLHLHIMSLNAINEGRDVPERYRAKIDSQLAATRVFQVASERVSNDELAALYTAVGTAFHPGGRVEEGLAVVAEAVEQLGLPADLLDAATDETVDDRARAGVAEAQALVGDDVGVPVIRYNGSAFFGPVVTPAPTGEDALRLWDGFALVLSVPGLYEIKRSRTSGPIF